MSPVVSRPLLRRRWVRSEPERTLVLAARPEAKAKSPVSPDGMFPVSWLPKRAQSLVFSHGVEGVLALSFPDEHAFGWHLTPP